MGTTAATTIFSVLSPLVGSRVYPAIAPDNAQLPYMVYTGIASAPENTLNDGIPLENDRIQLDTYAQGYQQAHDLADAARAALLGLSSPIVAVLLMSANEFDEVLKIHRVIQDFSVWHGRGT